MSDLLYIGKDMVCFIEVKTPCGRASTEQIRFIEVMKSYGHRAGIARSVEEALELINLKGGE